MLKFKDTGKLAKDITRRSLDIRNNNIDNEVTYNQGMQLIIEKWVDKNNLLVTDTNIDPLQRQYFKINKNDINIDYSDVTSNIIIPLLLDEGWQEKDLIKYV